MLKVYALLGYRISVPRKKRMLQYIEKSVGFRCAPGQPMDPNPTSWILVLQGKASSTWLKMNPVH